MKSSGSSHYINDVGGVIPAAAGLVPTGASPKKKILEYLKKYYDYKSVGDFGCAKAGWLKFAKAIGIFDVHGYDIPELDIAERLIEENEFTSMDLGAKQNIGRSFDLAISTEVAEHIPRERVGAFIQNLVDAAPVVLFSAAMPYQGGLGHVNEHWIEYWHQLFHEREYHCIDCIRDHFWHDPSIPYYYRQNILVFVDRSMLENFASQGMSESTNPRSFVHPEMYLKQVHRGTERELAGKHTLGSDVECYYSLVPDLEIQSRYQGYGSESFVARPSNPKTKRGLLFELRRAFS